MFGKAVHISYRRWRGREKPKPTKNKLFWRSPFVMNKILRYRATGRPTETRNRWLGELLTNPRIWRGREKLKHTKKIRWRLVIIRCPCWWNLAIVFDCARTSFVPGAVTFLGSHLFCAWRGNLSWTVTSFVIPWRGNLSPFLCCQCPGAVTFLHTVTFCCPSGHMSKKQQKHKITIWNVYLPVKGGRECNKALSSLLVRP